ncbi:MAG: response regulator transcription factor [Provencibacterium sp.]|nr:response regulator transcription factor [Provencibacterium sp.]
MKKILVVEDEDVIREFVVINLKRAGYDVTDVPNGEEALRIFEEQNGAFDVALLDIMMPGIDGFQVCKEIRRRSSSIGIILLSAKSQEMDKVSGLMMGADDYVTKPFSPTELVARVDAIHRRVTMVAGRAEENSVLSSGPFVLNLKSRSLHKNGQEIDLTQVEFQIMEFFMSNPGSALERGEILNKVWGEGYFGDVKIVDVNIRRLRMKIEDKPSEPQYLVTVWGFGYKWNA